MNLLLLCHNQTKQGYTVAWNIIFRTDQLISWEYIFSSEIVSVEIFKISA